MKAILKKDIGSLKKGTVFELVNGVFSADDTCFTQDLVHNSENFDVVEENKGMEMTGNANLAFA